MPTGEITLENALKQLYPNLLIQHEATFSVSAFDETTISGSDFTPALSQPPVAFGVFDSSGNPIETSIPKAVLNGGVYDITVQSSDEFTNAKVYAVCKIGS